MPRDAAPPGAPDDLPHPADTLFDAANPIDELRASVVSIPRVAFGFFNGVPVPLTGPTATWSDRPGSPYVPVTPTTAFTVPLAGTATPGTSVVTVLLENVCQSSATVTLR